MSGASGAATVHPKELRAVQELFQRNFDSLGKQVDHLSKQVEQQAQVAASLRQEQATEIASLKLQLSNLETSPSAREVAQQSVASQSSGIAPDVQNFVLQALEPCRYLLKSLESKQAEVWSEFFGLQAEVAHLQDVVGLPIEVAYQPERSGVNNSTPAIAPVQLAPQVEKSKNLLHGGLLQRVTAVELAMSELTSRIPNEFDSFCNETQQCSGPPEAPKLEDQEPQGARLKVEEPQILSSEDAKANDKLEHDLSQIDRQFEWEESVYDTLLFLFLPGLDIYHSLSLVLLFLGNLTMVGVTLAILSTDPFSAAPYADIQPMLSWKHSDGHAHFYLDPVTQMTLANRVCSHDETLSIGTHQKNILSRIHNYEEYGGRLLTNVAVILWVFCCAEEIRKTFDFLVVMLTMPRASCTTCSKDADGRLQFTGMTCGRIGLGFAIALVRFLAACALIVEGSLWLAYETSITDLLLNASALGFVLDIDNAIFMATASYRIISLVESLNPVTLPAWKSHTLVPIAIFLGTVAFMVYVNLEIIDGVIVQRMEQVKEALCEPETTNQHVIGTNPLGWITYANVPPRDASGPVQSVTADIINQVPDVNEYAYHMSSVSELFQASSASLVHYASPFECKDLNTLSGENGSLGKRLWAATGLQRYRNLSTCQDARPYCRELGNPGNNIRFLCPVTCGCAIGRTQQIGKGQFEIVAGNALLPYMDLLWNMATAEFGCPQEGCQTKKSRFLSLHPCEDANLTVLRQNGFDDFLEYLKDIGDIRDKDYEELSKKGCQALADGTLGSAKTMQVCATSEFHLDFHGLATACPVSCLCIENDCPGSCPRTCCAG